MQSAFLLGKDYLLRSPLRLVFHDWIFASKLDLTQKCVRTTHAGKKQPMVLHLKLEYRQFPNQFCIWQTHKLINVVWLQWSIITVCLWDQDRFYALLRNVVDNWIKKNHWPCMHRMSRPRDQSVRCACISQFKIKCLFRYFIKPLAICSKTIHSNCVFFFYPSSACACFYYQIVKVVCRAV